LFKSKLHILLFILALLLSKAVNANEEILGLAELEQLNKTIYVAAITGTPPSTPADYESNPTSFDMRARYVIEKYSARRNSQLWLNALLVSTSRSEIQNMKQAVVVFKDIIRTEMYKGDELRFSLVASEGTHIYFNDQKLASIKEPEFQLALVRYWFGERIASNRFVDKIKTKPSKKELDSFYALDFDRSKNSRISNIQLNLKKHTEKALTENQSINKVAKAENNASKNRDTTAQPNKTKSKAGKNASARKDTNQKSSDNQVETKNRNTRMVNSSTSKEQPQNKNNIKGKSASSDKKTVQKIKDKATNKIGKNTEISLIDGLYEELRSDYLEEVQDYIELNAKPVPSRKIRKKPKGNATITLLLFFDKDKMSVSDLSLVDGEFDDSLTESLFNSVTKLKKLPLSPEAIRKEKFSLEVSLSFKRCKRSTSAWICL